MLPVLQVEEAHESQASMVTMAAQSVLLRNYILRDVPPMIATTAAEPAEVVYAMNVSAMNVSAMNVSPMNVSAMKVGMTETATLKDDDEMYRLCFVRRDARRKGGKGIHSKPCCQLLLTITGLGQLNQLLCERRMP